MSHMDEFVNQGAPGVSADRLNEPFHLKTVTYDAGNNRLVLTVGRGRETFGETVLVSLNADSTVYINAPAINTTYYLYLQSAGTWLTNTTGAEMVGAILIWAIQVGADLGTLTRVDRRPLLGKGDARRVADDLLGHESDTFNPHQVTAAQAGAVPVAAVGAPGGVAELMMDGRIPRDITGNAGKLWQSAAVGSPNPILARVTGGVLEYSTDDGVTWRPAGKPPRTDQIAHALFG